MCGICGKVSFTKTVKASDILKMTGQISYRGPDDEGVYISDDKEVGLGNRRLAVQDLSAKGHMPMSFKKRYWITYNGEIYNFKELRTSLEKEHNYNFKSFTDTEVILFLYHLHKSNCLSYLRGMFAFAIHDSKENTLFLARDRIGKKPLKYFWDGTVFLFASELKALLTQEQVHRIPDWEAISHYFTFGYCPAPFTGFENIKKLEPGHYLVLDLKSKSLTKKRYWAPDFSTKMHLSETEWCERIIENLKESTRMRMVSDVPIGAFLSGGVDSSAIVAMMSQLSTTPVKTFTIGFEEKEYDERNFAEIIARKYNTDHQLLLATPTSVEILPELVRQYEEPFSDSSAIITYMVCKLAKEFVTVVLNGDGGDENFAGYDRYSRLKRDVLIDRMSVAKLPTHLASRLLAKVIPSNQLRKGERFLHKSQSSLASRFLSYNKYFDDSEKSDLFIDSLRHTSTQYIETVFNSTQYADPRDNGLFWDVTRYLPDDLLTKVDIASMSVSLEARSPLLDYTMIELTCQIPFDLKVKGFGNKSEYKYILKKALEPYIPKENLYRPKKGFSIPLSKWFSGKLNSYARSQLLTKNSATSKVLQTSYIRTMLENHNEVSDFGPKLWSILTFELWMREYFD
jgi:asparagine synthase (glutamine-hydrolysing)